MPSPEFLVGLLLGFVCGVMLLAVCVVVVAVFAVRAVGRAVKRSL